MLYDIKQKIQDNYTKKSENLQDDGPTEIIVSKNPLYLLKTVFT